MENQLERYRLDQDTRLKFSTEPSAGDEAFKEWREAMRRMAHLGDGLPRFVRRRVWSTLADHHLAKQHVDWDHVVSLAFNEKSNPDDHRLGSQIVKDLHRTGCEQFGSDEDRAALKRVLLAYARWNKRVGYCQGFNVIAAAILDAIERDEKVAFKIMVYLIDYVLPESYFAQNLQALSVDIAVFRQLLQSKLPDLAKHLDYLQYKADMDCYATLGERTPNTTSTKNRLSTFEPPLMNVYIIQWFLTLFATCLAPDAVMRIWDSILLEGSEVILRTAVVIMDFLASRLMRLKSADEFYSTMNELMAEFAEGRIVSTQELLYEIYQLGPFPSTTVKELRERFMYNVAPLVSDSVSEKADLVQKASNGCKGKFKNTEERNEENAPDANKKDAISEECSYHEVSLDCSMENLEQKLNCPNEQNHSAQAGTLRSRPKSLALKSNEEDTEEISANCMSMSWLQKTLSAPVVSNKPTISKTPPSSADYLSSLSRPVSRKSNQVNRRHSLSPKNSYTPKDISEVGPGAVGEECGPRPRSQPPSAHQARINTSLNELKSLYQKQIARQRGTTLKLPGLWDVDEPDPVSGILSQYASVTAVLPQNKETRQMDLVSSTNTLASTGGAEHSRSSRLSQSTECDEVFMESDISSKTPAGDPNERTGFLDASTPRGGSSDIDPDLLGAVKSWQEKAVWSSKPSIADNDVVCPSVVHPVHSKPLDRNSPKNPVTQATKKSKPCSLQPDSRHPTLLELASRASNLSSDPDVTLNANGNDSVSVVSTTYMSMRSETYSETLVSCASSFDDSPEGVYTRRASEPISNELLSRANGKNNNMKPDVVCSTQKNQYMQEGAAPCPELTDGDTESFCTTISHGTVTTSCTKKAPWEEAIASFLARKSLNGRNSQVPVTSHLPLSPTRQKFGAKFGMYKNISYPKNQRMPNFCDRVQMLELTRSALTQQELNCR
ncbi:unnamed protein product [Calicophoron daubneyi]|uniref:Rab-GAP TBC domain-containing protein n=1 Tax=Calicophoron daubneyi TaxID=300641 RepID=A0AAV2T987_CALDB